MQGLLVPAISIKRIKLIAILWLITLDSFTCVCDDGGHHLFSPFVSITIWVRNDRPSKPEESKKGDASSCLVTAVVKGAEEVSCEAYREII